METIIENNKKVDATILDSYAKMLEKSNVNKENSGSNYNLAHPMSTSIPFARDRTQSANKAQQSNPLRRLHS